MVISALITSLTFGGADNMTVNPFSIIEDTSSLPLLNPDLAHRKIAKLKLQNNLEVLLVSDPNADQSGAALAVEAGSWNDPLEYPGMAHFCEHMLFMGTEKYPNENDFQAMVSDYAGMTNAFTAPNRTVYMFASHGEGFLPLLDRFAHFFIDPLFNVSGIGRELHAVDQEFAKNLENDGWREYMIFKEMGNSKHPNRMFSVGNSETLGQIPQSALKEWHEQYYGANRMHLAIYSSLPMEELQERVVQSFTAIPEVNATPSQSHLPLMSEGQRGQITYIKPIQTRRLLTLFWELPHALCLDKSKSAELFAYALDRGQKKSLYEKLKEEQLVDGLLVRVDDFGGREHNFFQIYLELTQKGIEQMDTAILRCFQAIAGLKEAGVPPYLFEEKNRIAELHYQYQSRSSAFEFISKMGDALVDEEIGTFPRETLIASEYNPQKLDAVASFLTPQDCSITLSASPELTKVIPEKREKWCGAEYAARPIPPHWMASWSRATPNPDIQLADPNPFLPTQLAAVPDEGLTKTPIPIADTELGIAYYVRSAEFANPESVYSLHILSPELTPSARSSVLTSIYLDHLTDLLHPTLTTANSAGLACKIDRERTRINLQVSGFSEKAPLLLQEIAKQMPLNPPTREQFAIYVARHEKEYSNGTKDLPVKQAKELLDTIVNQDKTTKRENLAALKTIRYEDFIEFHRRLFEKTYIEAVFAGNLSLKDAESAWLDVTHAISRAPYPLDAHPLTKILRLPEQGGPFRISQTTEVQGHAAILLLDEGDFTFEKRAAQEILGAVIKEAFFDELRTKQKTGYIVQSDCTEIEEHLFRYFLVQSNSHQPEELLYRFELFIEEFNSVLAEKITPERFETLKASIISSHKTRFRNVKDKAALWDLLAFQHDADFAFVEKRINALQNLPYDPFLQTAHRFLTRENHKRLAVLFEGKIPSPFAYEPIGIRQLDEIASYTPRRDTAPAEVGQGP